MDGIKKSIVYSLYFENNPITHHNYLQLKKSIESIRKFSNIDIFIYLSSDYDLKENFIKTNNINIIKFDNNLVFKKWSDKIPNHPWNVWLHHRWINIFNFLTNNEYDKILYLDTDTIFYKSPEELFNKYNKDICYFKKEFNDNVVQDFIKKISIYPGINDGQMIISKNSIIKLYDSFENQWTKEISNITDLVYNDLTKDNDHIFFWNVSQYAALSCIIKNNIQYEYFDDKDIALGIDFDRMDKKEIFLHHYFSGNMRKYINE